MEFNYYNAAPLNEVRIVNVIHKIMKEIKRWGDSKLKEMLQQGFNDFMALIEEHKLERRFLKILNMQLGTQYTSIDRLRKLKLTAPVKDPSKEDMAVEESMINEDWRNFLKFWKGEAYPALSIFPTLQIWFQLDRLLDGAHIIDLDYKKMGVYAILWLIIVTGQHIILWNRWKKENPEEWEAEGKPGVFRMGGKKSMSPEYEI